MRIGPIGFWELVVILVIILLFFGRSRLPRLAKSIRTSVREFRNEVRQPNNADKDSEERAGSEQTTEEDATRALKDNLSEDIRDKTRG
ncbi:MAG: twin-arginine translocase TatA/TatE family subunit [Trueperaceae bacterium]|nr:twin-arginine translocase TatA/TatE family subunit [Trueperaceae bacterium]